MRPPNGAKRGHDACQGHGEDAESAASGSRLHDGSATRGVGRLRPSYRQSIDPDAELSELFKDVFLYHWKEECQHALLDELEFRRHDAALTAEERDRSVDDFIGLVAALDGILQTQAAADAGYFVANCGRTVKANEARAIEVAFLAAYRWQYIHSGARHPYFGKVLNGSTRR